jgi:voltage-gated potassium channel
MSQPISNVRGEPITLFQVTIVFLSVYALVVVGIQTFVKLSPEMDTLLNWIDTAICFVFLTDFFHRFYRAPSKLGFLKWGWIDFISSIPVFDQLRWGRLARVVRLFRILRAFRSTKVLITFLFQHKVKSTFLMVVFTSMLLTIFSSIAMLNLETEPSSNIKTAGDAIWWACSTITTVGYGDRFPVTTEGRIVAVILMTAGVGLFGTFTAFIAKFFLEAEQKKEQGEIAELITEVRLLREKIEALERDRR